MSLERFKRWLDWPMNYRFFKYSVIVSAVAFFLSLTFNNVQEGDYFFLVTTGKEIFANGIPHVNVWTMVPNCGFIAQQWLYCILMAWIDQFGNMGRFLFVTVEVLIFVLLMQHLMTMRGLKAPARWLSTVVILMFSSTYVFNIRPEIITMCILLVECIVIEHYRNDGKWQWLLMLPALMLLEMNVHASMWLMHFAIMFAYIVPAFYWPWKESTPYKKSRLLVVLFSILSVPVMWINPYGTEGVLYIIRSFSANTFTYVPVVEVEPTIILSAQGLCIILVLALLGLCVKLKSATGSTVNMTLGIVALLCYARRNTMFTSIICTLLMAEFCVGVAKSKIRIDWEKDLKRSIAVIFVISDIVFLTLFYGGLETPELYMEGEEVAEYIVEEAGTDVKVLTGFDTGAMCEYHGLHNIFIDSRPECYTDTFTRNDKNLLREYSIYCIYGMAMCKDDLLAGYSDFVSKEQMLAWLDSYDFDYIILRPDMDVHLRAYLVNMEDRYEYVMSSNFGLFELYRKVSAE